MLWFMIREEGMTGDITAAHALCAGPCRSEFTVLELQFLQCPLPGEADLLHWSRLSTFCYDMVSSFALGIPRYGSPLGFLDLCGNVKVLGHGSLSCSVPAHGTKSEPSRSKIWAPADTLWPSFAAAFLWAITSGWKSLFCFSWMFPDIFF